MKRSGSNIEDLNAHRKAGEQDGYSKCCIEFFIWLSIRYPGLQALMAEVIYGIDDPKIGYVRCPKCRAGGYY